MRLGAHMMPVFRLTMTSFGEVSGVPLYAEARTVRSPVARFVRVSDRALCSQLKRFPSLSKKLPLLNSLGDRKLWTTPVAGVNSNCSLVGMSEKIQEPRAGTHVGPSVKPN